MKNILSAILICIIFYSCSKKDNSPKPPPDIYPRVSYTLKTNFRNQVYNTAHSSQLDISVGYAPPILWDYSGQAGSTFACEVHNKGVFYEVDLYDSAVGYYLPDRSILVFTVPALNNVSDYYDTSVSINVNDTAYFGHAIVSVTFTSELNTPRTGNYITGNFSMSGTVANGYSLDSVSFSSKGTFTNMPLP